MPRQKASDQIEMLKRQQAELAAKLKEASAKARLREKEDAQQREKLAGRCILDHLTRHPEDDLSRQLVALLDGFLRRPADRALFPALAERTKQAEPQH